jgi:hypothetical protein
MLENPDGGRVFAKTISPESLDYFDQPLKNITQSAGRLQRHSAHSRCFELDSALTKT